MSLQETRVFSAEHLPFMEQTGESVSSRTRNATEIVTETGRVKFRVCSQENGGAMSEYEKSVRV